MCQAFGLKREQEVQTNYGKQRETWRDRLCRAVSGEEVKTKPLFLALLMQEQGWTYRANKASPSLRERLLGAEAIDTIVIEDAVRSTVTQSVG